LLRLGTLTHGVLASVSADGAVRFGGTALSTTIVGDAGRPRTLRPGAAPIAQTSWRIGHGDAVQRAYAVDNAVVVEIENASPDAIAVAWSVDGSCPLSLPRKPGDVRDDGAVVFPIPHRTRLRVALADGNLDVRSLADVDSVARGWDAMLDRGLRTEFPEPLQSQVDAARVDLLLAPPSGESFAALEAWGFDREAAEMWPRLGMRARRAAKRAEPSGVLAETRRALAHAHRDTIDLLPGFRAEWLGANVAVHEVPLRSGVASFAVRWHGARPALLWDVPPKLRVTAPALDAAFTSDEPVGEALLAEPSTALLAMGRAVPSGTSVDAPETFA
jgi:hypothetical protein